MKNGLSAAQQIRSTAESVLTDLQTANHSVQGASSGVGQIRDAISEQKTACSVIASRFESIAQQVEENALASAQMKQAVMDLSNLADRMQRTVLQFQV